MTDPALFLNRELSWLQFNGRVLHEAIDDRNPLLERLKFLAIFNTNLDEFYMVRVAGLRRQVAAGVHHIPPDGMSPADQLAAINARVHDLMSAQRTLLYDTLLPALTKHGVSLVSIEDLTATEWQTVDEFFEAQVFPVLTPLAVDPGHPFPYISNLSLSLAVQIHDPESNAVRFARVKVPKSLPRWIPFGRGNAFIPLEQVIGANLGSLFPGMDIQSFNTFRVTRYSDLELSHSEDDDNLLSLIEEQVFQRRFAEVVRIEVESGMPESLRQLLMEELREDQPEEMRPLADPELVETGPLLDLGDLMTLASLEIPELRDPPFVPATPPELKDPARSIFDVLKEKDVMVHHPFDSFNLSVEQFLLAAATDDNVLAIKMTLYRTSGDTGVVRALTEAAQRGKQVAVLFELQARFDEANNITWARTLEDYGVHVAYGLPGLKTHAKTTLVVRREADGIKRYAHIGSGNYNSKTARIYTDIGLLTSSPSIGADLTDLFNALTGFSRQRLYRKLLVAPPNMRFRFLEMIEREAANAREGKPARIIAKMNALVDAEIIEALYAASQAGVEIDLIVRGICCLRPGVSAVSDRIRVVSIVGRFLEHSRLFYFANGGDEQFYFGSADWMPRNLDRRVEAVAPIDDVKLHPRLHSLLSTCLADNRQAWDLAADGTYTQRVPNGEPVRATHQLLLVDSWGMAKAVEQRPGAAVGQAGDLKSAVRSTT
ncbi:MAG: RNA degradosome polyphosphate kinase [Gemmatimonadetes bacterium 13_1_40CM_2_60_3]|nr:MAG: RNA degradosome polyphosphate kinase [Gemmatimonadetes bacterium 13_1_40CM_2_60_3]